MSAATLDTLARLLEELIEETRLSRMIYEAHKCGPVAPPDDFEDPKVAFDPYDWQGASMKGEGYSTCPPEFLDGLARSLTNMARKEKRENKLTAKKAPAYIYSLQRAARARRWAIRLRCGWMPAEKPEVLGGSTGLGTSSLGTSTGLGESTGLGTSTLGTAPPPAEDDGTDFNFGANAGPASGEDDDEDLSI